MQKLNNIYNLNALSYSIKKDWLAVISPVRVLFATGLVLNINTSEEKPSSTEEQLPNPYCSIKDVKAFVAK